MKKKTSDPLQSPENQPLLFTQEGGGGLLTPVQQRLVTSAADMVMDPAKIEDAMFQHSIFCQTYLPYRNPGDDITLWEHKQGNASLAIQTIQMKNPMLDEWMNVGLPFGTRARLILTYINTQAIRSQSQVVEVEEHLTSFVKKLGLSNTGRTIAEIKEQVRRITASIITLGFKEGGVYVPINFGIVKSFDLWFPKGDNQKVIWANRICLTDDYFNSLLKHAIPLDERAVGALSHNAMAMDIYSWLVQRLHRIPRGERQFVAWQLVKDQFGQSFTRMDHFKATFRENMRLVLTQYHDARNSIEEEPNKGFWLRLAPTPIGKKAFTIPVIEQKPGGQKTAANRLITGLADWGESSGG